MRAPDASRRRVPSIRAAHVSVLTSRANMTKIYFPKNMQQILYIYGVASAFSRNKYLATPSAKD